MALDAPAHPTLDSLAGAAADEMRDERAGKKAERKFSLADPGAINREVIVAVARRCPPEMLAERIAELLNTKRRNKDGTESTDVRALEAGLKLALAYTVGLPTQRQEIVNVNLDADTLAGMDERLKASPALRAAVRGALERAEAEVIEIPVSK